jgi:hypothetical protein
VLGVRVRLGHDPKAFLTLLQRSEFFLADQDLFVFFHKVTDLTKIRHRVNRQEHNRASAGLGV